MNEFNEKTIWNTKQNHPELIVNDLVREFGITDKEKVRKILLKRGVNKWMYVRYKIINLKHRMKEIVKAGKISFKQFLKFYAALRELCNTQRWVEWSPYIHKKMKQNVQECTLKGKPC